MPLQRCLVLATALLLPAACVNRNYVGDRCAAGGCVDAAPGRDLGTFEGLDLGGPPPPLDLGAAASDDGFEPADLGSGGSDLAAPSDGGSDLG